MSPTGADLSKLDADAVRATQRLISRGFEAYLVGGCVRDLLLGRAPKDYDIATEARPPQVKRTFPRNSRIIGRRFKLAHLHFNNNTKILEVSTFRTSPPAESGAGEADLLIVRDNEFGTAEEDALRRDFTVNALFLDPTRDLILDYSNGLADLHARVIRTIGDPRVRFREDPVRILRAAKFAGRLGFTIEPETFAAMAETSGDLVRSAPPRLLEEILRLLRGGHALDSFQLLRDVGALKCLVPVLAEFLATARHEQRVDFWRLLEALDHRIQDTGHVPQNAVLLGVLLVCPVLAKAAANPGRSPSSIAEELLGPLSMSLRLPRRDAGCLKRICGVQHRFLQADETKRFRIEGFVHGPYFDEAFELFDLRMLASGEGHDLIDRWHELAGTLGHRAAAEGAFADGETVDHEHDEERGDFAGRGEAETDDGAGPAATTDEATQNEADGEADADADHGPAAHVETHDERPQWRRARTTPPAVEAVETPADETPEDGAGAAPKRGESDEPNGDDTAPQGDGGNRRRRRRRRRGRGRDEERSEQGAAPRSEAASASGPTADPIPSDDHPGDDAASPRPAALPPRRAARADFVHPEGSEHDDDAPPTAPAGDAADAPAGSAAADGQDADGDNQGEPRPEGEPGRRRRRRRRRGSRRGDQHDGDRFPASPAPAPHGEATDAETGPHTPLTSEETQPDPDAPLPDGAAADAGPDVDLDDGTEVTIDDGDATATAEPDSARDGERRGRRRRRRGRRGQSADGRGHQNGGEEAQGPHPASHADGGEDPATLPEAPHEGDEAARGDAEQPQHQHGRPRHEQRHQRGQQPQHGQRQQGQQQHGQQQHGPQRRHGHDRHQQGQGGQGQGGQGQGGQGQRQQHQQPSQRNDRRGDRQDRRDRRRGGRDGGPPQGSPRDVDVVPRYRDRRGKVDVIEPPPLDLSAFDVELDPKRVPTFGSIVEGKGRPKKRTPRVPEDGIDDYRPPPPPGSDSGPIAPPPPPPSDTPDTFGDW